MLPIKAVKNVEMYLRTYTLEKLKQSETKMHARDIVRREQEQIALLMDQKAAAEAAAEARVRELEKENEFLRNRIKTFT